MPNEACPLPFEPTHDEETIIDRLLAMDRIAVVGLSDHPDRVSYAIGTYLYRQNKMVIPVNPTHETVMGVKCYPSLQSAPKPIELVNVFRRSEYCTDVVRDAIAAGAKGVWLQSGISNREARRLAAAAGIDYIEDRCIMVEHMRSTRRR